MDVTILGTRQTVTFITLQIRTLRELRPVESFLCKSVITSSSETFGRIVGVTRSNRTAKSVQNCSFRSLREQKQTFINCSSSNSVRRSLYKAVFTLVARAMTKNGAVFTHLVPNLKICSHSVNRTHAEYCEIVGEVLRNQRKTCAHKDPVPSLVPEDARARILAWVLEKNCSQWCPACNRSWLPCQGNKCERLGLNFELGDGHRARILALKRNFQRCFLVAF